VSLGSFGTPLYPLLPCPGKMKNTTKKQGGGAGFIFDTLSSTLVVSCPPIGSVVCLSKCCDDVVDCSCESAGQLVYGPRIGFLGHFDPCQCKTNSSITSNMCSLFIDTKYNVVKHASLYVTLTKIDKVLPTNIAFDKINLLFGSWPFFVMDQIKAETQRQIMTTFQP
jgi:hypothetical protein